MALSNNSVSRSRVLIQSLLFFGVPGLAIFTGVHFLVPILVEWRLPLLHAWTLCVAGPIVANAAVVFGIYHYRESPDWPAFKRRFRLHFPGWKQLLLVVPTALVILILNDALAWTVPRLQDVTWIPQAPVTPEIFENPYASLRSESIIFMGIELAPKTWWVALYWLFFWVVLTVLSEEFVWRGYLLPLQEQAFGKWAWLLNGALWNIPFHLYTATAFFADMPFFLILPFLTQRLRNTWFAVSVHALLVSLAFVLILPGIFR